MKKTVLVVDLDGTLFSINTFHYFIKFLMLYGIKNLKLIFIIRLSWQLLLRLLKVVTHAKMKYSILKLITNKNVDYEKFVDSIAHKKRDISLLSQEFDLKILATAAPSCYAEKIATKEQFDACIATNFPSSSFDKEFENIKEVKKDNVIMYLTKLGHKEIDVLITDHADDLPLMRLSKRNIIVHPSRHTISLIKQEKVSFETLQ